MDAANGLKVGSLVRFKPTHEHYDKLGVVTEAKSLADLPVGKLYSVADQKWVDAVYTVAWQDGTTSAASVEYWQDTLEVLV